MASSTAKAHFPAAAHTQQPPASSSQLAEDDSRKKNTDCVYFLASPLTCKKGSECDYRHSEYARVNPRECWYWVNGTCLNPKCPFRHPPLDTPVATPADSSAAPTTAGYPSSTTPQVSSAPQVAPKSTAPCIFFQNGYCMKGDRCPFFHMQMSTTYRAPEFPAANKSESSRFNTPSGGLKNCSQIKVAPQGNVLKPIEAVSSQPKASAFALKVVPRDGAFAAKSGVLPHHSVSIEDNKHNDSAYRSFSNGSTRNKPSFASLASPRDDQRESSPGFDFDVLVHDEGGEADYYGNDDQFPGIQGHEGRDVNGRPDRYQSLDDPLVFHDRHGYEKYNPQQERRARDTSDRQITEGSHYDRRGDGTRTSDLRSRLSKQRRTNGLSSVVNTDKHGEEHRHRSSRRDSRHSPPRGSSSISSRLQGRIKLPGQASSAINPPIIRSERDYDRGRNYPRLSPNRPQLQPHRGRIQDRLKTKIQDDIGRDAIVSRRDVLDYDSPNFVAPKSLAELKKGKQVNKIEEVNPLGKRKALESSHRGEDVLPFEPPKPLSEILKRKRKAEDNNDVQTEAASEEENKPSPQAVENKASSEAHNLELDNKSNPAETEISQANNVFEGEEEEGLITEGVEGEGVEEEYYEEEGEGVYEEEEQDGGEGYTLEEGENGELEEEYMDEDEDDSFAKKIGVMFS